MQEDLLDKNGISRINDWVLTILEGNQANLSFDLIYSTTFEAIRANKALIFMNEVMNAFNTGIMSIQNDLIKQPNETLHLYLPKLFVKITEGINRLVSVFYPLLLNDTNLDLEAQFLLNFKKIIFDKPPTSEKMGAFLTTFAHSLPGSFDVSSKKSVIEVLIKLLKSTPEMEIFKQHLIDSTDAFCLETSSTLLCNQKIRDSPLTYIGAVSEIIDHERQLWKLLPQDIAQRLEETVRYGLIMDLILDQYLFTENNRDYWANIFIEDFSNLDMFIELLNCVLNDNVIYEKFIDIIMNYFLKKSNDIAVKYDRKNTTESSAAAEIEELVDIFDRLYIFEKTPLKRIYTLQESFNYVRYAILQDDRLHFEACCAKYIGKMIENIYQNKDDIQYYKNVGKAAKILSFSRNRFEFIDVHNNLMLVRLCKFAGTQYKIEQNINNLIQPYVPPSLADPFEEKLKDFQQSEEINTLWKDADPRNKLTVFILPAAKAQGIATSFDKIRLPPEISQIQNKFETFFKRHKGIDQIGIQWIYEDNIVVMNLKCDRYHIQLKMPLFFSLLIYCLIDKGSASVQEISDIINLQPQRVISLVKSGMRKNAFEFFACSTGENINPDSIISFNPKFRTTKKKFAVVNTQFSLKLAQKSVHDESMVQKRLQRLYSLMTQIMKEKRRISAQDLENTTREKLSASFPLNADEFNKSILYLESGDYIRRDGNYFVYIE